jgi:heat shock protein HslJ/membrane-bound inhibitor of C-type lysozyme
MLRLFVLGAIALTSLSTITGEARGIGERISQAGESRKTLRCGDQIASAEQTNDGMRLTVGAETFDLRRVRAASGARYEAAGDQRTSFWSKGAMGTLVVRGRNYPQCSWVNAEDERFRATGNEPGWWLDITGTTMTLLTEYGNRRIELPASQPETSAGLRRYTSSYGGKELKVSIFERRCADTMSGMPYPNAVVVVFEDKTLHGCGGDPAALLQGAKWVVEDLNGRGIVDRSRMTLRFGSDGRVSGRASCNKYSGTYLLTGEALTVSQAATTRKACAESLMSQEDEFLGLLRGVRRFSISPDGALILHTGDRRTIKARRK